APSPRSTACRATAAPLSPVTRCRAISCWSSGSNGRRRGSPTTGGRPPWPGPSRRWCDDFRRHAYETVTSTPGAAPATVRSPAIPPTIPAAVARAVERYGDAEALVTPDVRLTYAELAARVGEAARALIGRGVERGDRVAICAPNSAEWAIASLAIHSVGGVLV